METIRCVDVFLCYHIFVLLYFSCILINGEQDIYVTNESCGQEISLGPYDVIRFHYGGSRVYNKHGSKATCNFKIINPHENTEICIASPYGDYMYFMEMRDWKRMCRKRFKFSYRYSSYVLCSDIPYSAKCQESKEATAEFQASLVKKGEDFEVKVYTRYKATTRGYDIEYGGVEYDDDDDDSSGIPTWSVVLAIVSSLLSICGCICKVSRSSNTPGQNAETDGLSNEPFEVETPADGLPNEPFEVETRAVQRSDSPPGYESLHLNETDKDGAHGRDPNLPPYISLTDTNAKCPSAPLLVGEMSQDDIPSEDGALEEAVNRHTYDTSDYPTSSDNQANQNPPQSRTDLTERPPPPSYDEVVSDESQYLPCETGYHTYTCTDAASYNYS